MELAVEQPVLTGTIRSRCVCGDPSDPGIDELELHDVPVVAAPRGYGGGLALGGGEDGKEVSHVLALVDRDAAADLRDDVDQVLCGQSAQGLHHRLLAHPELRSQRVDPDG